MLSFDFELDLFFRVVIQQVKGPGGNKHADVFFPLRMSPNTTFPIVPRAGWRTCQAKMAAPLTLLLVVAVTVRSVLFRSALADMIADRMEVVSPLTAWKRGEQLFNHFYPDFDSGSE